MVTRAARNGQSAAGSASQEQQTERFGAQDEKVMRTPPASRARARKSSRSERYQGGADDCDSERACTSPVDPRWDFDAPTNLDYDELEAFQEAQTNPNSSYWLSTQKQRSWFAVAHPRHERQGNVQPKLEPLLSPNSMPTPGRVAFLEKCSNELLATNWKTLLNEHTENEETAVCTASAHVSRSSTHAPSHSARAEDGADVGIATDTHAVTVFHVDDDALDFVLNASPYSQSLKKSAECLTPCVPASSGVSVRRGRAARVAIPSLGPDEFKRVLQFEALEKQDEEIQGKSQPGQGFKALGPGLRLAELRPGRVLPCASVMAEDEPRQTRAHEAAVSEAAEQRRPPPLMELLEQHNSKVRSAKAERSLVATHLSRLNDRAGGAQTRPDAPEVVDDDAGRTELWASRSRGRAASKMRTATQLVEPGPQRMTHDTHLEDGTMLPSAPAYQSAVEYARRKPSGMPLQIRSSENPEVPSRKLLELDLNGQLILKPARAARVAASVAPKRNAPGKENVTAPPRHVWRSSSQENQEVDAGELVKGAYSYCEAGNMADDERPSTSFEALNKPKPDTVRAVTTARKKEDVAAISTDQVNEQEISQWNEHGSTKNTDRRIRKSVVGLPARSVQASGGQMNHHQQQQQQQQSQQQQQQQQHSHQPIVLPAPVIVKRFVSTVHVTDRSGRIERSAQHPQKHVNPVAGMQEVANGPKAQFLVQKQEQQRHAEAKEDDLAKMLEKHNQQVRAQRQKMQAQAPAH
ncbi:hypothetical protein FVE85_6300 [Porphyridium purpureum]|uniref:Uncharacterized protein n=1 Tax=Porphyridium purpureum TaxID=35688 RepID=A0A5J4Z5W3_PORPP|nr:hypothetical protein FVE85_6300 [Porphyridium purpureum]|eukprot:POR7244..scf295_1